MRGKGPLLVGLPNFSDADHKRVLEANHPMRWAFRIFQQCARNGTACIIENPEGSRLWEVPLVQRLPQQHSFVTVDACAFGGPWRKRTRLIFCNAQLHDLCRYRCTGQHGICSFTGVEHQQLSGRCPTGQMWSTIAAKYPTKFCNAVMQRILDRPRINLLGARPARPSS